MENPFKTDRKALERRNLLDTKEYFHSLLQNFRVRTDTARRYLERLNRFHFDRCNKLLALSLKIFQETLEILEDEDLRKEQIQRREQIKSILIHKAPHLDEVSAALKPEEQLEKKIRRLLRLKAAIKKIEDCLDEVDRQRSRRNTDVSFVEITLEEIDELGSISPDEEAQVASALIASFDDLEKREDELDNMTTEIEIMLKTNHLVRKTAEEIEDKPTEIPPTHESVKKLREEILETLSRIKPCPILQYKKGICIIFQYFPSIGANLITENGIVITPYARKLQAIGAHYISLVKKEDGWPIDKEITSTPIKQFRIYSPAKLDEIVTDPVAFLEAHSATIHWSSIIEVLPHLTPQDFTLPELPEPRFRLN